MTNEKTLAAGRICRRRRLRWGYDSQRARRKQQRGFEVIPKRWVAEQTVASLGRCRRLTTDCEACIESGATWVPLAHIRRLTQQLVRTDLGWGISSQTLT
jgi:transposase